jgi:hypothetical protein
MFSECNSLSASKMAPNVTCDRRLRPFTAAICEVQLSCCPQLIYTHTATIAPAPICADSRFKIPRPHRTLRLHAWSPFHVGIILIEKAIVVVSSRQQSEQPATARVRAGRGPSPAWSPGVRVESKPRKPAPWRPMASKSLSAKSFVLRQFVCKCLIFLKWHGRGRRFEPDQVHQTSPQQLRELPHSRRSAYWLSANSGARSQSQTVEQGMAGTIRVGAFRATASAVPDGCRRGLGVSPKE